jgi:hypothetical protein
VKRSVGGEWNDGLAPDFVDFVVSLNRHQVDCVLVGAYALAVYGVVRATADIDFLYRREADNVRRLCNAMDEFGAPPNVIDFDALMAPDTVAMFGAPPHRIDLLGEITGVSFDQVWAGKQRIMLHDNAIYVIGPAELLENKAATGRDKDSSDVRRLRAAVDAISGSTQQPSGRRTKSGRKRRRSDDDPRA